MSNQRCSEWRENTFGKYFWNNYLMVQNDFLNEIIKISFNGNFFTQKIFEISFHSTKIIYSMSISHMMNDIKNDDEKLDNQSWNHHNKNKINPKQRKWWKRMHFVDVKKVYFHQILLDEWKGMNWWILINFIHFLCSFNFNEFVKIVNLIKIEWSEIFFTFTWSGNKSSQISTLIFILNC